MENKHIKCFIVRQSKRLKFTPKMRQNTFPKHLATMSDLLLREKGRGGRRGKGRGGRRGEGGEGGEEKEGDGSLCLNKAASCLTPALHYKDLINYHNKSRTKHLSRR